MRVLETEVAARYSMGKKNKHKLRKSKENEASDSSEDVAARGCPHVSKAVNFSAMKKGLGKQAFGECAGCAKESSKRSSQPPVEDLEGAVGADYLDPPEPVLWVCLQCGNQGCGRGTPEKHALKHFETPRSSQHNVVINTESWTAWCYECDDEVAIDKHKKISECMDHLKKLACVPVSDAAQGKNGSGSGGASSSADTGINKGRPQSGKGTGPGNTCPKVKGLSNLGNTCFFNAVMQNLIQTYSLENLLGERKKAHQVMLTGKQYLDADSCSSSEEGEDENNRNTLKELPSIEINISDPGPLTHSLVVFLYEMNTSSRSSIINPSALFGQVCKKAPRFKGMQQQDSHELLRYLLDNMKTEEIKRGQTGILKYFKISENVNTKKVDEDVKSKVKVYGRQVKHTFVECLFGGQLISTVICEECKYISQILEPFLDLSLPVTEEKPQRPSQSHGLKKKEGSFESKEEVGGGKGKEDEKPSKHQSKKQKKKAKREARLGSKNKILPADSQEHENEEEDGEKDSEEKDDGERKSVEQEEKYDASDADVEDNLESDTSRCFNNAMTDSNATMDESTIMEIIPESTTGQPSDYRTESQSTVFNIVCRSSSLEDADENEPVNDSVTEKKGCDEDVSVSFTVCQNGMLTEENPQQTVSTVCEVYNGVNGNNESEVFDEDFEFIDAPSPTVESVDPAKSFTISSTVQNSKTSIQKSATKTNTIAETFSVVDKNAVTNEVNVTVEIPIAQRNGPLMNGPLANGIGSSTDSEKLDLNKATLFSDTVDITEHVNEITDGVNSLHIVDEKPVTLPLPNQLSKLTLEDVKNEKTKMDDKNKSSKTILNFSEEIKAPVVKSEEFHDEEHGNLELNGDTADGHIGKTPNPHSHSWSLDSSNMHMHSHISNFHPSSAKHNRSWKEIQKEGKHKSVNPLRERYHPSSGECSIESCLHQFTAAELLTGNNKFGCKNCTKLHHKHNPNKEKKECVYSNASKQYLIFQPPAVLTLHLKRFEQVGFSSRKVNRHVEFPFILDIAPYCSSLSQGIKPGQKKVLYSLYGVVEHSGRLTSGHYTAYVKVRANIGTLTNFLNFHNVTVKEYLHKYAVSVINGDRLEVDSSDDSAAEALVPPGRWYHISDSRVNEVTEASVERAQAYLLFYERIY